jgi:hypothetical protein
VTETTGGNVNVRITAKGRFMLALMHLGTAPDAAMSAADEVFGDDGEGDARLRYMTDLLLRAADVRAGIATVPLD